MNPAAGLHVPPPGELVHWVQRAVGGRAPLLLTIGRRTYPADVATALRSAEAYPAEPTPRQGRAEVPA